MSDIESRVKKIIAEQHGVPEWEVTNEKAFVADLGLMAFFFFYTMAFTWAFDRVFGLPASAAG